MYELHLFESPGTLRSWVVTEREVRDRGREEEAERALSHFFITFFLWVSRQGGSELIDIVGYLLFAALMNQMAESAWLETIQHLIAKMPQ